MGGTGQGDDDDDDDEIIDVSVTPLYSDPDRDCCIVLPHPPSSPNRKKRFVVI